MIRRVSLLFSCALFMASALAAEESPVEAITRPQLEYKAEGLRDPFAPLIVREKAPSSVIGQAQEAQAKPLPDLKVQGLVWGGKLTQAIINEQVVKVGDIIEEAKIISISKDGIIIFFEGKQYNLAAPASSAAVPEKPQGGQNEKDFYYQRR